MKRRVMLDDRIIRNLIKIGEDRIENITGNNSGDTLREFRAEIAKINRSMKPLRDVLAKRVKK